MKNVLSQKHEGEKSIINPNFEHGFVNIVMPNTANPDTRKKKKKPNEDYL